MTATQHLLDLNRIAARLESMEETIISKLIDRAQFAVNGTAYEAGNSGFTGETSRSLFDLRMRHHERMDALFGRFCVPEERPFTRKLPHPKRTVTLPDTGLHIENMESVNLTGPVRLAYLDLVQNICIPGDDGQYGSSVEHDVYAIQAIARRIHYGAFYVAESKLTRSPETFRRPIADRDTEKLIALLTRGDVEERIIDRVYRKTIETQKGVNPELRRVIDADTMVRFYRETIIPLTKQGEAAYLLHRNPTISTFQPAQYKFNG